MDKNIQIITEASNQLKLVAITKDKLKAPLVNHKHNQVTLVAEEKTYYLYLGEKNTFTRNSLRDFFLNIGNVICQEETLAIDVSSFANDKVSEEIALQIIYEALLFASHKKYSLKTTPCALKTTPYALITQVKLPAYTSEQIIETQSEFINLARDLQDMPPNILYPEVFAKTIEEKAKGLKNLTVKVLDKKAIQDLGMGLLLSVNAGSHHEPRVVVLEYTGDKDNKEIVGLIGKGITFDSGGYSLKPSTAMKGMKFDMSGAAIVCNTALSAAKLELKTNFIAVACVTENRIGGHATLVETVATSMNGKTVEINNTDAEGRLVLADGMTYAIRNGKATKLIEFSTLTGAILIALGDYLTGAFSHNDALYNKFLEASIKANEEIWRMPIHEECLPKMQKSPIADLSNISIDGYGGSSTAAAFLNEFAEGLPYLHLDIAGTAEKAGRGKAVHIKTLIQYLKK